VICNKYSGTLPTDDTDGNNRELEYVITSGYGRSFIPNISMMAKMKLHLEWIVHTLWLRRYYTLIIMHEFLAHKFIER
jgi:hypothetical protein